MMGHQGMAQRTSGSLRRIALALTIAALMVVMMAASAIPAMAKNSGTTGGGPPNLSGDTADANGGATVIHSPKGSCVSQDSGKYSVRCT